MKENIYKKGNKWHYDLTSNGETFTVIGDSEDEVLEKMHYLALGDNIPIPQIDFAKGFADFSISLSLLIVDAFLIYSVIILAKGLW